MFHCPVGVWVIEQHAIILSVTVRSPTVTNHSDNTVPNHEEVSIALAETQATNFTCRHLRSRGPPVREFLRHDWRQVYLGQVGPETVTLCSGGQNPQQFRPGRYSRTTVPYPLRTGRM